MGMPAGEFSTYCTHTQIHCPHFETIPTGTVIHHGNIDQTPECMYTMVCHFAETLYCRYDYGTIHMITISKTACITCIKKSSITMTG